MSNKSQMTKEQFMEHVEDVRFWLNATPRPLEMWWKSLRRFATLQETRAVRSKDWMAEK